MTKTVERLHVSQLPERLRGGRSEGFVTVTVEDAPELSDEERLAWLRAEIAVGLRAAEEGRVTPAEEVFARLKARLPGADE